MALKDMGVLEPSNGYSQWWDSNILGTGSISNIRTTMVIRYIQVPRICNFSKLES